MAATRTRRRTAAPRKAKPRRALSLRPVGVIRSTLRSREHAPVQGPEGAPDAWIDVEESAAEGLRGVQPGDELVVVTWLHRSRRDVLLVQPGSEPGREPTGVFATRSPDRPNPLGLHPVTVRQVRGHRLRVGPIEAIDGTPVVDIKPVLPGLPGPRGSRMEAAADRLADLNAWRGTALKRIQRMVRSVLKRKPAKAGGT